MRDGEQLKVGDLSEIAQGPGRTAAQTASRWRRWVKAGIIPADHQIDWRGGPANLFPRSAAAVGAILFDLFDAEVLRNPVLLAQVWKFFSEHEADEAPKIIHVLAETAAGNEVYLIVSLWRHQTSGHFLPMVAVRFSDELERPIEAPSAEHVRIVDHVVPLHVLLAGFTGSESNVTPLRSGAA